MEETVWAVIGIIMVILTIGILGIVFQEYRVDERTERFLASVGTLRAHADDLCAAPRGTQLSVPIDIPSGGALFTADDVVCGAVGDRMRCERIGCAVTPATLVNLSDPALAKLFSSRTYRCSVVHEESIAITCAG